MAVMIDQVFPLGRFHATRWRQNPFEDRYGEWPPSPWRLLRALAARWFQYTRETGDDDTKKRDDLLRALASELPTFQLPAATWRGQELRQYQPTAIKFTKKKEVPEVKKSQPTLAIDAFRALCNQQKILWVWQNVMLPNEQWELLADLLRRIHYFGRAESFTVLQLSENRVEPNCVLVSEGTATSVPVLAHSPDEPLDMAVLLSITDDKRIANRPLPPGTAWYQAVLPAAPHRNPVRRRITSAQRPQVVRFALDSTVLPLITETLPVAEATRRAMMSRYGILTERNGIRGRSRIFSGKDENGNPLTTHGHAYYLPTDEDNDGRLDHLTVVARDGFGPAECQAFDRLHTIKTGRQGEERHPLRVLLLGLETLDEYRPLPLCESKVWISVTPYIATKYAKTRGRQRIDLRSLDARVAFLVDDLRAQVSRANPRLPLDDLAISPLIDGQAFRVANKWRPIQFKRLRQRKCDDGGRRLAGAFQITFAEPVAGPLCFGHSSHFGLGLFLPKDC